MLSFLKIISLINLIIIIIIIFIITFTQGKDFSFENFKGKVVYGVNVASKCGYTASGYALLSKIAEMKDQGVEVAIFPCNQFGGQEVNDFLFDYLF